MASLEINSTPLSREEKHLARRLTQLLRHGKPRLLKFRPDGFVQLCVIRSIPGFEALDYPLAKAIVAEDNKQRFSIREEGGKWWIRANQGHTVKGLDDEQLLTRVKSPLEIPTIVHGTYYSAWNLIRVQGLSRMKRNHIHFATGLPADSGVVSGMRKSAEILIYLDGSKAMDHGIEFYISSNGVILTSGAGTSGVIPPSFFLRVVDTSTGQVLSAGTDDSRSLHFVGSGEKEKNQEFGAEGGAADHGAEKPELEALVAMILRDQPDLGAKKVQLAVQAARSDLGHVDAKVIRDAVRREKARRSAPMQATRA